jgi:hypothetical protein
VIPTIWYQFFDSEALPPSALQRIEESDELASLRRDLRGRVDPSFWSSAANAIGDALHGILNTSVLDVLLRSWRSHPEVRERLRLFPASTIMLIDLGEHEIVSRHRPRIEITSDSRKLGTLQFALQLDLMVQRARLQLERGLIKRGTVGACSMSGRLALGETELARFPTRELTLPEQISFGAGVPIEAPVEVAEQR